MTDLYSNRRMLNEEEEDSPTKCRERRRRRIEMRRMAAISASGLSVSAAQENLAESSDCSLEGKRIRTAETADPASSSASSEEDAEALSASPLNTAELSPEADVVPVFGSMSVTGRPRDMEDAICVRTNLCMPEINRRRPVHFFGVYDGHGGPHVAALCRERMHVFMEEELMRVGDTAVSEDGGASSSSSKETAEGRWRMAMQRCFERMDELALNTCSCGSVGYQCGCQAMEVALTGSTAVVAVVTANYIVVANCGDSRAVLCRAGKAVPLSSDHKPDRADELARIEASGGRVIFVSGARVEGILAMSRAVGDKYLKPIITSEPEISFTKRDPQDECLILASDGLWDVLSSDMACEVASECLREGRPAASSEINATPRNEDEGVGALYPSRSALAAALLTRLALGRKSADNISVIVVDLKRS